MRSALALGFFVLWPVLAGAQGAETRYFTSIDGLMDGNADIVLKEVRSGRAVTSAMLDVCYPATPGSNRKDRFVVSLAASGQSLSGTATTLGDKLPVTVKLTRKMVDGRFDFSGEVTVGQTTTHVESTDNADMSEAEFRETRSVDNEIFTAPRDFTEVSPEALAVRVRLDAVADVLKGLKGQDVEVAYGSLAASCDELRAGAQVIDLNVDPQRASGILTHLRATPGVLAAGWTAGNFDLERTLRFTDTGWREGGKIDRARIATTLADTLKRTLKAQTVTTKWDDALGRLTITLKRPNDIVAGLGLTETLEALAIVAPDQPGSGDHLLLWLDRFTTTTTDESAGDRLRLAEPPGLDEEGGAAIEDGESIAALAAAFKAQRWDVEREAWK